MTKNIYAPQALAKGGFMINHPTIESLRYALDKMQEDGTNPFAKINIYQLANAIGCFIVEELNKKAD